MNYRRGVVLLFQSSVAKAASVLAWVTGSWVSSSWVNNSWVGFVNSPLIASVPERIEVVPIVEPTEAPIPVFWGIPLCTRWTWEHVIEPVMEFVRR